MKPKAGSLKGQQKRQPTAWLKREKNEKALITNISNERGTEGQMPDIKRIIRENMDHFIQMGKTTLDKMEKFLANTNYKGSLKKLKLQLTFPQDQKYQFFTNSSRIQKRRSLLSILPMLNMELKMKLENSENNCFVPM